MRPTIATRIAQPSLQMRYMYKFSIGEITMTITINPAEWVIVIDEGVPKVMSHF